MRQTAQPEEAGESARTEDPTVPMPVDDALSSGMVALEHSPAALGLATLAGDLLYLNAKGEQIFGVARGADLTGRNLADICSETAQLGVLEAVARDGRDRNLCVDLRIDSAAPTRLLCKLRRIAGYGGIPTWLTFVLLERDQRSLDDDTTLGEAESMSIMRRLTGGGSWKMRLEDRDRWTENTLQWDTGLKNLLGLRSSGPRFAARHFLDLIAREDREPAREAMEKALLNGSRFEAVYRVTPRSGSTRIVLSRAVVAPDPEASAAPTLIGTVQDISSAVGHEMHSYEKAAILDTIAANLEAPVFAVDRDLRYTYFNAFFGTMMRRLYAADPVLGERAYETVSDDARRRTVLGYLRRALSGARVVEELPISLDDAVVRHYELTYSPIRSAAATGGVTVFGIRSPGAMVSK